MNTESLEKLYGGLSDRALVSLTLMGDDDAMLYLIDVRYLKDVRYYCQYYFKSYSFVEDLSHELFLRLKGDDGRWNRLSQFGWKSSFRTWLSSVMFNLFNSKRAEYMGFQEKIVLIDKGQSDVVIDESSNRKRVMLLEAIGQLKDEEYRLVLLKELEGYSAIEIAEMLKHKREVEGNVRTYRGEQTYPTVDYVYMVKSKAVKELKRIFKQEKED